MRVRLRSVAEAEVAEAIRWYDHQRPGLGSRFLEALNTTLAQIEENPRLFPQLHREVRRALFPRPFPYLILYRIDRQTVSVFAVLHQARAPSHWEER
jgi:toxin ParE1/3/4